MEGERLFVWTARTAHIPGSGWRWRKGSTVPPFQLDETPPLLLPYLLSGYKEVQAGTRRGMGILKLINKVWEGLKKHETSKIRNRRPHLGAGAQSLKGVIPNGVFFFEAIWGN